MLHVPVNSFDDAITYETFKTVITFNSFCSFNSVWFVWFGLVIGIIWFRLDNLVPFVWFDLVNGMIWFGLADPVWFVWFDLVNGFNWFGQVDSVWFGLFRLPCRAQNCNRFLSFESFLLLAAVKPTFFILFFKIVSSVRNCNFFSFSNVHESFYSYDCIVLLSSSFVSLTNTY